MTILNIIKEALNQKFVNAKIEGTGRLAPRPGYYFIKVINHESIGLIGEVPIATVNWKARIDDFFIEEVEFKIALSSLYCSNPTETQRLQIQDLIGKVIYIHSPMFINKFFDGIEKSTLNCSWNFVVEEPKFLNVQNEILNAFIDSAKTLTEACKNFADNAPYDVASAEEVEVKGVFSFDEDPNEGYDDFIEGFDEDDSDEENLQNPDRDK